MRISKVSCKLSLLLLLINFSSQVGYAQDVWLQSYSLPVSGCSKTSSETVQVSILNNSLTFMVSGSITASYTVDGGPVTSQTVGANMPGNASINLAFNINANLLACGPHTLKVWVQRAGDPNQLNDTLTWVVQNDCPIIPGTILSDANVCSGNNNGSLSLTGWTYGTITDWQTSTDGGGTWNNTGIITPTYNYTNISQPTQYRVFIDGGFCPDAYSGIATLTPVPPPTPGTLSGVDSLCITNATGSISLTGTTSSILQWESSTNNGVSWNPIANTTYTNNYTSLTGTTWFRTLIDGDGCPDIYSDTLEIFIDTQSDAGTITGSDSLCITNANGSLVVNGNIGPVDYWEFSTDGTNWFNIANTSTVLAYNSLVQTTYYRAHTVGEVCPNQFSDTAVVFVQPDVLGGTISGSGVFCNEVLTGQLDLLGNNNTISDWEFSIDNGGSWNSVGNSTSSNPYTNITTTTLYRVLIDGAFCPDNYSDTATIQIDSFSDAGILVGDTTACAGSGYKFELIGAIGNPIWETSGDGITWTPNLNAVGTTYTILNTQVTGYNQVIVTNGVCPPDTSNIATITILPLPTVSVSNDTTITEGDSVMIFGVGGIGGIWLPNSMITDNQVTSPTVYPTTTTYYSYNVIDINGCISTDSVLIIVNPPTTLDIKNVITSNGDGYNDFWIIEGVENYPMTEVHIFNIYGKEVYSDGDYSNDWAGTYKGKQLPNGTYFYVVKLSETKEEFKGNLTILGDE